MPKFAAKSCSSLSPAAIFVPLFIHVAAIRADNRGFRRSKLVREEKRIFHESEDMGRKDYRMRRPGREGNILHCKSNSLEDPSMF